MLSQPVKDLEERRGRLFRGPHMHNYQNFLEGLIASHSELDEEDHLSIGDVSPKEAYFFDPLEVTPLVQAFLNRFFAADIDGIRLSEAQQAFRHDKMKELRSKKLQMNQEVIESFGQIPWKHLQSRSKDFTDIMLSIQEYLDSMTIHFTDETKFVCSNICRLSQQMLEAPPPVDHEVLRKFKSELNVLISKIEAQIARYHLENKLNDGSPALCLSFLLITLGDGDKQCLVSLSSPELNENLYEAIKRFILLYNAENEAGALAEKKTFVPYKLLAESSENFDALIEAVNVSTGGKARKNVGKKCAEKPLASSLMKFFYKHPMELKGESLCNIQLYPFKKGVQYGPGTHVKAPLDSSELIELDRGLYVPSIPCCHDCKHMKNAVLRLWRGAQQKGILKREKLIPEMQSQLGELTFFGESSPECKAKFKDEITSPAKESPLKRRQHTDDEKKISRLAIEPFKKYVARRMTFQ